MQKALTSVIVSIAMVTSSVSAIAADTTNTNSAPVVVQTGPLSPGGPVVVSPAQGTVADTLGCGYDVYGVCGPIVLLGVVGMGVALAAIMGAFSQNNKITSTVSTTGTGG
ncbi:MAG: hypothetical protein KGO48_01130 [Alphaproteobacteria bacterium]|nr:hypothetical protein [Alphaproteobacteria bacterium]